MIIPILDRKIASNEEIRNYADENMQKATIVFSKLKASGLHELIDIILREKNENLLKNILFLVEQDEFEMIKKYSDDLEILSKVCDICEEELLLIGETILEKVSSLKELKEIYQETVFQFRRMELETEERYEEFEEFMSKWKFSIVYIKLILENGAIYNKANVAKKLIEIFSAKGNVEYSNELYDFLK